MKSLSFSNKLKKITALLFMGYFSVISPAAVLAQTAEPVSAPVTVPVIIPQPTAVPSATPRPTPRPVPVPLPKPAVIFSIAKPAAKYGDLVGVYGRNFGAKAGMVLFYNQANREAAGAPITAWHNNSIRFRVPAVSAGNYLLEIQTSDNRKSNKVNFTVTAAQPQIQNIFPVRLKAGRYFIISGKDFGNNGRVYFYKASSAAIAGSAIIRYWSDSYIIGQIPSLPGNQIYGIQIRSTALGNRDSSLVYRYISK